MTVRITNDNPAKQSSEMLGVGSNPGLILDSYQIKGPDGYIEGNTSSTSPTSVGFMGGECVRADGPNKRIISTNWLTAGAVKDVVTIAVSYDVSTTTEGPSIAYETPVLEGIIYKRDSVTQQIIKTYDIHYTYQPTTCKNPGSYATLVTNGTGIGMEYFQLTPQHEYKFEIKTSRRIESHQSILVDYIKIEFIDPKTSNYPRNIGIQGQAYQDIGGTVGITQMEGFEWVATLNSAGYAAIRIQPFYLGKTDNYFNGVYDYVASVVACAKGQSGTDSITASTTESTSPLGGRDILLQINTGFSGGVLYGFGFISGWRIPKQL